MDPETCPQELSQFFSRPYPNPTYGFASTEDLWKVVLRVPVGPQCMPWGWSRG